MFSHHIQRVEETSYKVWLGVAAGLVMACQLVAMALVVDGEVDRAHSRGVQHASERSALAQCSQSSPGSERQNCMLQVQAAAGTAPPSTNLHVLADAAALDGNLQSTSLLADR